MVRSRQNHRDLLRDPLEGRLRQVGLEIFRDQWFLLGSCQLLKGVLQIRSDLGHGEDEGDSQTSNSQKDDSQDQLLVLFLDEFHGFRELRPNGGSPSEPELLSGEARDAPPRSLG